MDDIRRVKRKIKGTQNPLFERWLSEWKEEAKGKGSDMQYCFGKALRSLQKYPFKLNSGKECMILESFGNKICQMLDDKLKKQGDTLPALVGSCSSQLAVRRKRKSTSVSPVRKKAPVVEEESTLKGPKEFVPVVRSGSYALLLTLLEKSHNGNSLQGCLTKKELQLYAQNLCDSSFTKAQPGSHYTAWSCMATLLKKQLVTKSGNPAKFQLSEKGVELALQLKMQTEVPIETQDSELCSVAQKDSDKGVEMKAPSKKPKKKKEAVSEGSQVEVTSTPDCDETVFLLPGTFEVVLLVDNQETDNALRQNNDATIRQLKSWSVNFEVRHLKVGDFAWVAKDRTSGQELVLPYVVERKRLDDFGQSIKDGRFHEQKFRLKKCCVENLVYLVEKCGSEKLGLPLASIQQAAANTQIVDGFHVRVTNNHEESMHYLSTFTCHLTTMFQNKTLMSCKKTSLPSCNVTEDLISLMTFKDFNSGSGKSRRFTVSEMLVKHLIQLKGLSVEKAMAITDVYPTPAALIKAMETAEGEKLVGGLACGALGRTIGPVAAKSISQLYSLINLT